MTESGGATVTMDTSAAVPLLMLTHPAHQQTRVAPPGEIMRHLPAVLAPPGIAGGAVYDALVGLAAHAAGSILLTRDARAIPTYSAVGALIEIIG